LGYGKPSPSAVRCALFCHWFIIGIIFEETEKAELYLDMMRTDVCLRLNTKAQRYMQLEATKLIPRAVRNVFPGTFEDRIT
jgi:hypothetical protein